MKKISILDCTLRDGGYINNFGFGKKTIQDIIEQLGKAHVDIIECGFLRSGITDENLSLFGNVTDIKKVILNKRKKSIYVAMIQYGKISNEEIEPCDGTSIDGIRITFHEHEVEDAFVLGKQLKEKGYKLFMQPVGTISYTDNALISLISKVNKLKPYAFYLVDTLGTMYQKDIRRLFYLIDNNLAPRILLGFHAHNNIQQAFPNAQELMQMDTSRKIIIDSTVHGLGRGAGNLCTELILQYINDNIDYTYNMLPILKIIDEYISVLKVQYSWGYSAAYYLASIKKCHPNYATFLLNRQTLTSEDIYHILDNISLEKRILFDEDYILQIYKEYKSCLVDDSNDLNSLIKEIGNRDVVLVAPGKNMVSVSANKWEELKSKYYLISVNFIPENIKCNRTFFSNEKRYFALGKNEKNNKLIITSNIKADRNNNIFTINYSSYLNDDKEISDNAGIMCINLLKKIGIKKIALIGFDGFETDQRQNYALNDLYLDVDYERIEKMNKSITNYFKQSQNDIVIEFLTESQYNKVEE